jgi:hypothetical protein
MKKLILATCLTALSLAANAQQLHFASGNKLLNDMNSSSVSDRMYALGYVAGAADTMNGIVFCLPPSVTVGQVNDMVKNYLTNAPQDRHFSADSIIAKVFGAAFPCPKGGNL